MVHIHDEGGEFDAPLKTVWEFLSSPAHGPVHKDRRNPERKSLGENVIELSAEQDLAGKWERTRSRITLFPPVGYAVEVLEGPLAGSRSLVFYTPKGSSTGITVVAEYVSPTLSPPEVEVLAQRSLDTVFDEDRVALREFAGRR